MNDTEIEQTYSRQYRATFVPAVVTEDKYKSAVKSYKGRSKRDAFDYKDCGDLSYRRVTYQRTFASAR